MKIRVYYLPFLWLLCMLVATPQARAQQSPAQDSLAVIRIEAQQVQLQLQTPAVTQEKKEAKQTEEASKGIQNPPLLHKVFAWHKIFWAIVFALGGYFIIRFSSALLERFAERNAQYRIQVKGLLPIIKIFGWLTVLFIIIEGVFAPPIETILTISASLGIAVGFASQDILQNVFGGILILLDAPFKVGDKVEIGGQYGEVVEIGLRSTRIVTPDDSLVSVPNGKLMNEAIINSNAGEPNCQVVAELFLPPYIDTQLARKIATEVAQTSQYIYLNKPITVLFFHTLNQQRPYLKMRLKAYVMDIRFEFNFKSEMTELFLQEARRQGLFSDADLKG